MAATVTLWNKQMRKFLANPEEMFGLLIRPSCGSYSLAWA